MQSDDKITGNDKAVGLGYANGWAFGPKISKTRNFKKRERAAMNPSLTLLKQQAVTQRGRLKGTSCLRFGLEWLR